MWDFQNGYLKISRHISSYRDFRLCIYYWGNNLANEICRIGLFMKLSTRRSTSIWSVSEINMSRMKHWNYIWENICILSINKNCQERIVKVVSISLVKLEIPSSRRKPSVNENQAKSHFHEVLFTWQILFVYILSRIIRFEI